MGKFKNPWWWALVVWIIAVIVMAVNVYFIIDVVVSTCHVADEALVCGDSSLFPPSGHSRQVVAAYGGKHCLVSLS